MAYLKNGNITASDINSFIGPKSSNTPFISDLEADKKLSAIYGIGYGSRGYGQTGIILSPVSVGDQISTTHWLNLRSIISTIASHQGVSTTLLPPASRFTALQPIYAESQPDSVYSFSEMLNLIDTNRFNTNSGSSMSLTTNAHLITRNSSWGAGNSGILCEFTVNFNSENDARFFFNSGGEIRLNIYHPTGSTQDNNWSTLLSNIGNVSFKANSVTKSGSSGSINSIGYYQLTGLFQQIISASGTSAYSANNVVISVRSTTIVGVNGGNGSSIQFRVSLSDIHTNAWYDIVSSGTQVRVSYLRASVPLSNIPIPTFTTNTSF